MKKKHYKVEILAGSHNAIQEERESGRTHSPFALEYDLFLAIRAGNKDAVIQAMDTYVKKGFVIGRMSVDPVHEIRYWAVATVSTAVHYAILGGLDETDAYNLSDACIRRIDEMDTMEEIIGYLSEKAVELTNMTAQAKQDGAYSDVVSRVIHYVHIHLHEPLKREELACAAGMSCSALSARFHKETGLTLHSFVMKQKLQEAQRLLATGTPVSRVSYLLAFCSQSHFITCFKKEYGITPVQYQKKVR